MLKTFTMLYGILAGLASFGLTMIRRRPSVPEDDLPTVAVVVAARNEERNLPNLIGALVAQEYPESKVNFLIVDDDSEDATWRIARSAEKRDKRFHALRSDPLSSIASPKKRALDTGIRACDAEWIVTTDADCQPGPGWLRSLASSMRENIGVVLGYAPLTGVRNPIQVLAAGESWSAAVLCAAAVGAGYPFNAFGRNFAYRRQLYLDLGGYGSGSTMASGDDDLFLQHITARTDWKAAFSADPRSFVPSAAPPTSKILSTKARHLSVGPKYAPGWVAIGAISSALFMGLGLATVAVFFGLVKPATVWSAWKRKWLFDLILASSALRVIGDPPRAVMAMATASSAPFLLWAIWPKALFGNVHWKGRTFVRGRAGEPIEDEIHDPAMSETE
ncbi:MAG: glycosyltransferase [bacterium]